MLQRHVHDVMPRIGSRRCTVLPWSQDPTFTALDGANEHAVDHVGIPKHAVSVV